MKLRKNVTILEPELSYQVLGAFDTGKKRLWFRSEGEPRENLITVRELFVGCS